jgi:hypothetical protein
MAGKSTYLEQKIQDHMLGTPYSAPSTWYLALFSAAPTDSGGGTEQAGSGYARKSTAVSNWSRSGSVLSNNNNEEFAAATASDWSAYVAFGIFDASSGGNLLYWNYIAAPGSTWYVGTAATSDTCTVPGHPFADNDLVVVSAVNGATLPTGISEGQQAYIINSATGTFKLSATEGGSAIDITAAGVFRIAKSGRRTLANTDVARFSAGQLTITEY